MRRAFSDTDLSVKRADPDIQLKKVIHPTIQPDPAQELSLGVQQTRHKTRELCVVDVGVTGGLSK